ncbi:MAG: DUF86 domain-containing protein [Methanobacteriaceae archaeon]|nr:DUF86 domain-containing protein [Methanobacteriaceae archaeon]
MKRDVSIYLKDILENIKLIELFISKMSYEEFEGDKKTYYAVIRCIEIIGEAVKHIPDSVRQEYPEIPWKDIAGMRDKVIHFYFGVDLEIVWLTITKDIPEIKTIIKKVLEDYDLK